MGSHDTSTPPELRWSLAGCAVMLLSAAAFCALIWVVMR